jgi:glycosyltransferase involved in cell wall biosynthesis
LRAPSLLAAGPLPPPISGMAKAFQLLVKALPEQGWSVETLNLMGTHGETFPRQLRALGDIVSQAGTRMRGKSLFYLTISQSAAGFIKDSTLLEIARRFRVPSVVHMHGGNFRGFYEQQPAPYRAVIRRALNHCSRIIVLGPSLRVDFSMVSDWETKTVIVPNPCDVPLLSPRPVPKPGGKIRILFLSNLVIEKGYLETLSAGTRLAELLPDYDIEVHLAGAFMAMLEGFPSRQAREEDFQARLRQAQRANLKTVYHGVVQGEAKEKLFAESDVFVLPTRYIFEGQPISILEALSSALPVVATAHRGIPDVLAPSHKRCLVPPEDSEAIAQTIAGLIREPGRYEEASRDARAQGEKFRLEQHLERMNEVLQGALS